MFLFYFPAGRSYDPLIQEFAYIWQRPAAGYPLTLLADTQAAFQLLQRNGPVLIQVTVVAEFAGTFLGFGFLLQVSLKWLQFLLVDVMAAIVVQLGKVPVHHSFLQSVTGIRFDKPEDSRTNAWK